MSYDDIDAGLDEIILYVVETVFKILLVELWWSLLLNVFKDDLLEGNNEYVSNALEMGNVADLVTLLELLLWMIKVLEGDGFMLVFSDIVVVSCVLYVDFVLAVGTLIFSDRVVRTKEVIFGVGIELLWFIMFEMLAFKDVVTDVVICWLLEFVVAMMSVVRGLACVLEDAINAVSWITSEVNHGVLGLVESLTLWGPL